MKNITKSVWGLWPTVEEMAEDLTESVNRLRLQRDRGELPDEQHDRALAVRARAMGKRLTIKALKEFRANPPSLTIEDRRRAIADLIAAAGGYQAASDRTGVSVEHLRVCKTRGALNRNARHEYKALAREVRLDLPEELFETAPR